jgi:hypothetical protein
MMNTITVVRPKFLCSYGLEIDAQNICAALKAYGISAWYRAGTAQLCNYRADSLTYCVWVNNEADFEKAREFKRGLLSALQIKAHPQAFLDGIQAAAKIMSATIRPKLLELRP